MKKSITQLSIWASAEHRVFAVAMTVAFSVILSASASAQSGTVFRDYDGDGTQDPGEPGVAGVLVKSYIQGSPDALLGSATSGATGTYTLAPAAGAGQAVRVEFTIPLLTNASSCLDPTVDYTSTGGGSYGSSVQFVTGPVSGINFAMNNPEDFVDPALTNPTLWTQVYQNGNATQSTKSLVGVPYNASGEVTEANISALGATWGLAYSRHAKRVFVSAFLKRHVGLGPLGSGGIYMVDPVTNAVTNFINLDALGFPTRASGAYSATFSGTTVNFSGVPGTNAERNLPASQNDPNNDPAAFAQVGKVGLGDLDISDDGRYLWVTNLFDRKLYRIDLQDALNPVAPTAAQVTSYTISNPCGGTDNRPFGVRVYRDKVYVGIVCSGESGGNPIGNVLEFNGTTFSTIFTFPLNYTRPAISGLSPDPATFVGWSDNYALGRRNPPGTTNALWSLPQPILSDIEFDIDGTMILGIMDRAGHQMGWGNWEPQGTNLWITVAAGDILRAYRKTDCSWELESNGKEGPSSPKPATAGAGNGQGPGGGEFYVGDNAGAGTFHSEGMLGGLALKKGSGEVVSSCYDPNGLDEFGIVWLSNTTGVKNTGYTLGTPGNPFFGGSNNTFGKGGAVGDMEIEANLPDLEIGNRVWMDTDNDGVQDGDEMGIGSVPVELYKVVGMTETLVGATTTNGSGQYYFNKSNVNQNGATGILPFMNYKIRIGTAAFSGGNALGVLAGKILGTANVAGAGAADLADNDATNVGGRAEISLTTGDFGQNNHTYDFAFAPCALNITGVPTNPVCPGASTGSVNITVTGAVGTPTYAWSNAAVTEDLTNVPAGIYTVVVNDPGVCSATYTITLTDPAAMVLNAVPTASPTCSPSTGSINLTVTGAAPTVTYLWSNTATTEDISGLAPGTYTVVVTDGNGCMASTSAMVGGPTNPTLMATPTPVSCFGESTGSINLTVTPGSAGGPNTFLWSNTATTEDISGLAAGTYTVQVTDAGGCTASTSATVNQPAAPLVASATASTTDCINGNLDLTVTGGTPAYTYVWSTGATTQDISVPAPGTYTVDVTDMNGCTTQTSVVYGGCDKGDLPDPSYPTLNASTGAGHVIVTGLKIGATVDAEADGQPNGTATGDGADEDGFDPLAPVNMLVAGRTTNITIPVMNMSGGDAKLTVYFDWNKDNDLADPNEMYTVTVPNNATSATLVVAVPADAVLNMDLGTRFRLTTSTAMSSTGFAPDGEVEDYLVQVMGFDYGDLPDTGAGAGTGNYETQDANSGPSHKIVPGLKLGNTVDAEGDGQQSMTANGDDSATAPGTDDENGVILPMFVTGVPSNITVDLMNMTGGDAKLTVFIDFNNNGVFEASEMFSTTVANNATSATIPVTPPLTSWLNAPVGVRVRLSTDMTASMSPTGPAPDGEVEDYTTIIMGYDWGDLNDTGAGTATAPFGTAANHNTLATDNGAAHKITTNPTTNAVTLKIGAAVDDEATGQPSANAGRLGGGDDAVETPDDEDGLNYAAMPLFIVTQTTVLNIPVMNMTGSDAKLVAWCDFNKDGDFLDAGEMVSTTVANNATTATINFPVPAPPAAAVGEWVGLRLRLAGITEPMVSVGPLNSGEVEDYEVQIIGYDYGDQPNSYGTVDPNAPRHIVSESLKLGASVDAEINGAPDPMAGSMGAGDDGNVGLVTFGTSTPPGDDENGVMLASPMVPGYPATFMCDVMNMTTSAAVLQAWVDFNGDGDFLDANEHLTTGNFASMGANVPVGGLSGAKLTFDVPASATFNAGNAHVRFRLSPLGGLAPNTQTDPVPFGEIEDYKFPLAVVGNLVWEDRDFDGTQDAGEPGINDVGIMLTWAGPDNVIGGVDDVMYITTTGPASGQQQGEYYVPGLINGTYKVKFTTPTNMTPTRPNQGSQTNGGLTDSDGTLTGMDLSMAMETFTITNVTALPTAENGNGDNGTAPTGTFPDAQSDETHDQGFAFLDYGDLPESGNGDQFNTSMGELGAVHVVIPGFKLGASVDGEQNGVGNANADADDANNTGSADDEDGVSFITPLIPGYNASISVVSMNMTGANAVLQGWIDWNNNGLLDATESLAFTSNVIPQGSVTTTFTFPVPSTAIFNDGMIFARFRLSPTGGLSADGPDKYGTTPVPQGEVEDYMKKVMCAGNMVWEDYDFDGQQDPTEPGIGGVTVNMVWAGLDGDINTTGDNVTYTTTTLSAAAGGNIVGEYSYCGLIEGTYKFVAMTPSDMTPTLSNTGDQTNGGYTDNDGIQTGTDLTMIMTTPFVVTVPQITTQPTGENGLGDNAPGNLGTFPNNQVNESFDFGFVAIDFGDLPDTYVTDDTPDNSGAQHVTQPEKYLGSCVDAERNTTMDANAGTWTSGDDFTGSTRTKGTCAGGADDENGVQFITPLVPGAQACVRVTYTALDVPGLVRTGNTYLSAWIDYNGNNQFDGGEQAVTDLPLTTGTAVVRDVCFTVPNSATFNGGAVRTRFRIHCQPGLGSAGLAIGGEVEDYYIPVAKAGNYVWFDNDLRGDQTTTDNPIDFATETGINNTDVILIWGGLDGNLTTTADNRVYPVRTQTGPNGENADGIYCYLGLIEGQYRVLPRKYAGVFSGAGIDSLILAQPQNAVPVRKILTIANNAPATDYIDSDGTPSTTFAVPNLLASPTATLGTLNENGVGDIPTILNYPDRLTNLGLDFGFVQEPNIELNQKIAGVEKGSVCGQFKVIVDLCIQNSGGYENGYVMAVPLNNIQAQVPLQQQLGAAFLMTMGAPQIMNGTWECGTAANPQQLPSVNPNFNGTTDVNLFTGTNGLLWPGEKVVVRYVFEVKPSNVPEPGSLNLLFQANGSGKAVNYQGQPIPNYYQGGAQYMAMDLSDDGLEFNGTYNDPNQPTSIGDCWKTTQAMAANDQVQVSVDENCEALILDVMILEGEDPDCTDDQFCLGGYYKVRLRTPQGLPVPNPVTSAYFGQTIIAEVENIVSCNKVWGSFTLEDKLAPEVVCTDVNVPCVITDLSPANLTALGHDGYPTVDENCSTYTWEYSDEWFDLGCTDAYSGYLERYWEVTDASGNSAACLQTIYIDRLHVTDIDFPTDVTLSCAGNVNTHPTNTGAPYYTYNGVDYEIYPGSNYCEMQTTYSDQVLPVCDGTYKILRTWVVYDWCLPTSPYPPTTNPQYFIQLIKVVDETGPSITCPADLTVSTDPLGCCATVNLPDVIVTDACSRIDAGASEAYISVYDPYTGALLEVIELGSIGGSTFPGNNEWNPDTLIRFGNTPCLPVGTHEVTYRIFDLCGNASECTFELTIEDLTPPTSVCDEWTQTALGIDGMSLVNAETFDDGSYDNCADVHFKVRRMDANGCQSNNRFYDQAKFCCSDVNDTVMVVLRVYDVDPGAGEVSVEAYEGHYNDCMVQVLVEDKLKPACTAPANVTVTCEAFDPSLWAYGNAQPADNCCLDETKTYLGQVGLSHTANYNLFDSLCNRGTITRRWTAYDCYGNTSQCTQRIIVNYVQDYFVKFPNDVLVTTCDGTGTYGAPTFFGEDCELLAVSHVDEVFTLVPDACYKIERTWTVLNWCRYNPNGTCITVPNPEPNATVNSPANLPGPTVSEAGTLAPWAPTVVAIAPGQAATNYSTFWDANANCYKYKQIIKIFDTQDPTVDCPASPVEYCDVTANNGQLWNEMYWWDNVTGQHDLCEGPTDLTITATDACSGSDININYLLFLDLDGDGTMETVVNSRTLGIAGLGWNNVKFGNAGTPNYGGGTNRSFDERGVPANQKYGFALQTTVNGTNKTASVRWNTQQNQTTYTVPELPYGTHKIKWFIEDNCGNEKICEYTFVVKDCKKPTVVCLNGLSVNIMPTQMITLWASDFLQYTEDNCTPTEQLRIAIRKSGTGTGFPVDGNGNPITSVTFTCAELGTQLVELWSRDLAGNADFCETYVIVQDNMGACGTNATIAGALKTAQEEGVEDATVQLEGSSNGTPMFDEDQTNVDGQYAFSNALPILSSYTVTPGLDNDHLNGVSTYDLVLINKHILGAEPLNTPYKLIAADANKSGTITTFDIVEIRKLILGIYNELPQNTSWRFVDKTQAFTNPQNPFLDVIREDITVAQMQGSELDDNFVGVKIGDVNESVVPNQLATSDDRTTGTLLFDVQDRDVKSGEVFEATLQAADQVKGYQFTLNLTGVEVVEITPGAEMSSDNFGVFADAITTSYDGAAAGEFTLKLRATKSGRLSEMLNVSNRITRAEAYGAEKMSVGLRFNNGGTSTIAGVGFELYQNSPNPWMTKTQIGFNLPESTEATLTIHDQTGRVIYTTKGQFEKGYNAFTLNKSLLDTNGTLYYTVQTATDKATMKMIQAK